MIAVAVDFHNIPGAMMRVLNCFTRRGVVIQAVWCGPEAGHHRVTVLAEAEPKEAEAIRTDQIVRELESTVGVERVERLDPSQAEQLAQGRSPEMTSSDNGSGEATRSLPQSGEDAPLFPEERKFVSQNWEQLQAAYAGRYIAVRGTSVFDSDADFSVLADRVFRRFGYQPTYMPFIGKSEKVYRIPSPRLAR